MIDAADMERLKEVFVTRRECDTITDDLRETLNSDKIALAEIKTQLAVIKWIGVTIGGCVITMLVKTFAGG